MTKCPTCKKWKEKWKLYGGQEVFKILADKDKEIARLKAELSKAVKVMKGKPRMEQVMVGCIHCGKSTPTLMPIQKCRHCNQFHESHIACIEHENLMNGTPEPSPEPKEK